METSGRSRRSRSARRKNRRLRSLQTLSNLWSEWKAEITIGMLLALGVFLLVEQLQIRRLMLDGLGKAQEGLNHLAGLVVDNAAHYIRGMTLSDLVGLVLLCVATVFIVRRTRWRLMTTPRFTERRCPRCDSELYRIHRRFRDRLLNLFVPVRRYRCRDRDCRWQGLRVARFRHE